MAVALAAACGLVWCGQATAAAGSARAIQPAGPATRSSWTVYHGNAAGTGVAAAVRSVRTSARAWTSPHLDGQLYGEPLIWSGRVYVATQNDTVYALSAARGKVLWSRHLASPVPASALPCGDITPTVGITGTPVIDRARDEIFVVAAEMVRGRPAHVLVGLNAASGRRELARRVDPPHADAAALLQRTGLNLDGRRVVFGFGGNFGDCASYRGRVAGVPMTGGSPGYFTVDAGTGQSQGAVWMGGAAPAVDGHGHIWVSTGNGSVHTTSGGYDNSDGVLKLSASLRRLQYFAPASWASDNARDLDMSMAPALLPGGEVILAGKSGAVYLLNGAHLPGIGRPQATLRSACGDDIDGGAAVVGTVAYLPCLSGIIAVRATGSPPRLRLLWRSQAGGGPPIVAASLVWTIGQDGTLYGLSPATGKVRQRAVIGTLANHFPTPSAADGLLLAPAANQVVAFRASGRAAAPDSAAGTPGGRPAGPSPGTAQGGKNRSVPIGVVVGGALVLVIAVGLLIRRRTPGSG